MITLLLVVVVALTESTPTSMTTTLTVSRTFLNNNINETLQTATNLPTNMTEMWSSSSVSYRRQQVMKRVSNWEKIAIYSILFVIASIGNTTSFIALLFMSRQNRSQNFTRIRMLFMNLCIADLMVTYIHLPLEIVWAYTDAWLAGEFMCKLMMFVRTFGLYLSSFIIIAITIDRYYVIVKPLEMERVYRLNKLLIASSWLVSFASSLPQVYVFEILNHPLDPTFQQCVTFGKLNTASKKIVYNMYHFVGCYGLPLLIMIYCYAKIFSTITTHSEAKHKQQLKQQPAIRFRSTSMDNNLAKPGNLNLGKLRTAPNGYKINENGGYDPSNYQYETKQTPDSEKLLTENELIRRNTNRTYLRAKFRTLRLSALIVVAFLFSWTPYYVCVLWAIISPNLFTSAINKKISSYLFTFAVSNSCFNPIVYGIFSNKLYQFLPCLPKKEAPLKKLRTITTRNNSNVGGITNRRLNMSPTKREATPRLPERD